MTTLNTEPIDRTKREHVGSPHRILWHSGKEDDPHVIFAFTDGRVATGKALPKDFALGLRYRFLGRWEQGNRGPQFRFDTFVVDGVMSQRGVVTYLTKFASNVGTRRAEELFRAFAGDAVATLRENPELVAEKGIMSLADAKEASADLWKYHATERTKIELHDLFSGRGFPSSLIQRCIDRAGAKAPQIIRNNPFALLVAGMPGASFNRCLKLWNDLDKPRDKLKLVTLSAWHYLRTQANGNTWLSVERVSDAIRSDLRCDADRLKRALRLGIRAGWIARERDAENRLFLAESECAREERVIADAIADLLGGGCIWPREIPVSQVAGDGLPSAHQREQALRAIRTPVGILAGTPGTGKSHTLAYILREILAGSGVEGEIAVACPTGKAAVRCNLALRSLGLSITATTIHKLLGIGMTKGGQFAFKHNRYNPLPYRFLIIDESSMIDTRLLAALLDATQRPHVAPAMPAIRIPKGEPIPPRCRRCGRRLTDPSSWEIGYGPDCRRYVDPADYVSLTPEYAAEDTVLPAVPEVRSVGTHVLFIGDPNQLPPVGHGAPFRDLIESKVPSYGELSEVRRNAGRIVHACAAIKDGKPVAFSERIDLDAGENLKLIPTYSARQSLDALDETLRRLTRFDRVWQTQVIVPRNKQSELARGAVNERLRNLLNPDGLQVAGNPFRCGDKIMCLRNGFVEQVRPTTGSLSPECAADPSYYDSVIDDTVERGRGSKQIYVANGEIGRVVAVGKSVTIATFGGGSDGEPTYIRIPIGKSTRGSDDSDNGGSGADIGEGAEKDDSDSDRGRGCNFDLAYAVSGHKMQGSESPCVIVMIDPSAGRVASREWIYTSISRASRLCILIGNEGTLREQVGKVSLERRKTFLREQVMDAVAASGLANIVRQLFLPKAGE